jgi:uncharacterized protein (DUF1800 family)
MTSPVPFTYADAAHLLRRAAFGGTPAEIERAVLAGREAAVDSLLDAKETSDDQPQRVTFSGIVEWWVARMLRTSSPLTERLTFFWHNHFATSISTVRHAELMLRQNELFRAYALGDVRELVTEVARDPGMLIWLDNHLNRKEHANENFGRELLELFTLGLNGYAEEDVIASARAFTGWTLTGVTANARHIFNDTTHDGGTKQFLGRRGEWNGDDIVRIACSGKTHARFLARKLFAAFVHDDPAEDAVERLANLYLRGGNELRPLVRAILLSDEMYAPRARWSKVKSPIDHAVIACRQLAIDAGAGAIASALSLQGLMLFSPPDVSGWSGGMSWISSWSLLARTEFARAAAAAFDPPAREFASGEDMVAHYLRLLGPLDVAADVRKRLVAYGADASVARQRGVVRLILSLPEWQRN